MKNKKFEARCILRLGDVIDYRIDRKTKFLILDMGEKGKMEIRDETAIADIIARLEQRG